MVKKCEKCKRQDATVCENCCDNAAITPNFPVVNSVLTYMRTYYDSASSMKLKMAVLAFYNEDELNEAKSRLVDCVTDLGFDVKTESTRRQNSVGRSAKEATVDDLMCIFEKIDHSNVNPEFVTADITRLPPSSPEAGGSVLSVMEMMATLRMDMEKMQESHLKITTDLMQHSDMLKDHDRRIVKAVNVTASAISTQKPDGPVICGKQEGPVDASALAEALEQVKQGSAPSLADIVKTNIPTGDDGFTVVTYQKKKQPKTEEKRDSEKHKNKQRGTQGTAGDSGGLRAGPERFKVQLTNVHPSITKDIIETFISDQDDSIKTVDIEDTSSPGWETKRYIVTFEQSAFDTVMTSSFWPRKIYYRQWFTARPKAKSSDDPMEKWTGNQRRNGGAKDNHV